MKQKYNLPHKISVAEIQADLRSIGSELKEVRSLKTTKERINWAKANPEKYQKIWNVYMKYEIQYAIETLEQLLNVIDERFKDEKRVCEAIISRGRIPI
jgi:hypothetical protein